MIKTQHPQISWFIGSILLCKVQQQMNEHALNTGVSVPFGFDSLTQFIDGVGLMSSGEDAIFQSFRCFNNLCQLFRRTAAQQCKNSLCKVFVGHGQISLLQLLMNQLFHWFGHLLLPMRVPLQ